MINTDFKSISEIIKAFPNEQACLNHLETLKWNGIVVSPFDANSKVYVCKKNRYRCRTTGKYFNTKNDTIFYNSKIELQKWFIAIWLVSVKEKSITSIELGKTLEITQKSAWYMIKNIKAYLELDSINKKMTSVEQITKKERVQKLNAIETVVEEKKLPLAEWLQQFKK
jgi:transposase-like protein